MPPGEKKLSAREKQTIAAWIDQGPRRPGPSPSRWPPASAHRGGADVLVVPADPPRPTSPRSNGGASGTNADRRVPAREARDQGARLRPRGRPAHVDPPRHASTYRSAADPRRGRRVPRRHCARRLRAARRPTARARPITASAGPGTGWTWPVMPTATVTRPRDSERQVRLQVPRLPGPVAQRRPAVGRADPRATGRRRDGRPAYANLTPDGRRQADRDRIPADGARRHRRRRGRSRTSRATTWSPRRSRSSRPRCSA